MGGSTKFSSLNIISIKPIVYIWVIITAVFKDLLVSNIIYFINSGNVDVKKANSNSDQTEGVYSNFIKFLEYYSKFNDRVELFNHSKFQCRPLIQAANLAFIIFLSILIFPLICILSERLNYLCNHIIIVQLRLIILIHIIVINFKEFTFLSILLKKVICI